MADAFRKFLCISSETRHSSREKSVLERVSWENISQARNLSDYDHIYLNLTALAQNRATPIREAMVNRVFDPETWADVLAAGGSIVVLGDPSCTILVQRDTQTTPARIAPVDRVLMLPKDHRELDYRRTVQTDRPLFAKIYKYLDSAAVFKYSLMRAELTRPLVGFLNSKHHVQLMGFETICRTSYSTFLATQSRLIHTPTNRQFVGSLTVLPSLYRGIDAEDLFVLQEFFGIPSTLPAPDWTRKFRLPGQEQIEKAVVDKEAALRRMQEEIERDKLQLDHCKRWQRLLYDDGHSLEDIVKESLELLGATVSKPSKEKDDYRVQVSGFPEAVVEIKGTHNAGFTRGALRQLAGWMDEVNAIEGKVVKGLFIGNGGRNNEPETRAALLFEPNCDKYAHIRDIAILRSLDLYCLTILKRLDLLDVSQLWTQLFQCKGAFDATQYWQILPKEFKLPPSQKPEQHG